jgi:hypothetical protein
MNKKILRKAFDESPDKGREVLQGHMHDLMKSRSVGTPMGLLGVLRSGSELLRAVGADSHGVTSVMQDIVAQSAWLHPVGELVWPAGAPAWEAKTIAAARRAHKQTKAA